MRINGEVEPGFESLKTLFENEMHRLAEKDAQLCIYHKGVKVVDLWATHAADEAFTADSLVTVFSSGKSLESIAMAHLVDKGLLNYNDKVAKHWPEFAANGKADITVADVMRHEAGLMDLKEVIPQEQFLRENIKNNSLGKVIEALKPTKPKTYAHRRNYHALSRGWIVNEIFRRVEPDGKTIGEYIEYELAKPLDIDIKVGVKTEELERRGILWSPGVGFELRESFKPKLLSRRVPLSAAELISAILPFFLSIAKSRAMKKLGLSRRPKRDTSEVKSARPSSKPKAGISLGFPIDGSPSLGTGMALINEGAGLVVDFLGSHSIAQGESSSFNANCSARGLAKLGAVMAAGGSYEGREYIGKTAWRQLHHEAHRASLGGLVDTHFTQGGVNLYTLAGTSRTSMDRMFNEGREGFYGWIGLGGSTFQWHPMHELSFAFVPTAIHLLDPANTRAKLYQAELLKIVSGG